MRQVIFLLEFLANTKIIKYPDSIEYFSNVYQAGENLIADYSGNDETIQTFVLPPMPVVTITAIVPKNESDAQKIIFDPVLNILYAQMGAPFRVIGKVTNVPINDIWNTPVIKNGKIEAYFLTTNDGDDLLMQGSFPSAGMWEIDEDVINAGFVPPFKFTFPKIIAKVFSEF